MVVSLSHENYYDDTHYMSTSRLKAFMECESKRLAVDEGFWEDETETKAFLTGNFIHSYFESEKAHADFLAENEDKLIAKTGKNKGNLLADFQVAQKVCEYLEKDKNFMSLYNQGTEKEYIVTGNLYGLDFKGKLDSVNREQGYFVDLKTMASVYTLKYLSDFKQEVPQVLYNIFTYGYDMQFFVYRELLLEHENNFFDGYLMAVSKELHPQKKLFLFDEETYANGQKKVEAYIKRLKKVLNGTVQPRRCENCDYCKATQKAVEKVTVLEFFNQYQEAKGA